MRVMRSRKIAVQENATNTCIAMPSPVVAAPPSNARAPMSTLATPCQSRVNVDPYAKTLSAVAKRKSTMAVVSPARNSVVLDMDLCLGCRLAQLLHPGFEALVLVRHAVEKQALGQILLQLLGRELLDDVADFA